MAAPNASDKIVHTTYFVGLILWGLGVISIMFPAFLDIGEEFLSQKQYTELSAPAQTLFWAFFVFSAGQQFLVFRNVHQLEVDEHKWKEKFPGWVGEGVEKKVRIAIVLAVFAVSGEIPLLGMHIIDLGKHFYGRYRFGASAAVESAALTFRDMPKNTHATSSLVLFVLLLIWDILAIICHPEEKKCFSELFSWDSKEGGRNENGLTDRQGFVLSDAMGVAFWIVVNLWFLNGQSGGKTVMGMMMLSIFYFIVILDRFRVLYWTGFKSWIFKK